MRNHFIPLVLIGLLIPTLVILLRADEPKIDFAGNAVTIYLDELDLSVTECGWNSTRSKRTVEGNRLRMNGKTYQRGIGHHAPGTITIELPPVRAKFHTIVGIDDEVDGRGHAEFLVYGDGKLLWRSGFLTGKDEPKTCEFELDSIKRLVLRMDEGPEGYGHDHGNWADAKITLYAENELIRGVKTIGKGTSVTDDAGNTIERTDETACEFLAISRELKKGITPKAKSETLRKDAIFFETDRDPVDVVLRRTRALMEHLRTMKDGPGLVEEGNSLDALDAKNKTTEVGEIEARKSLFADALALRKEIAFQNPLFDFDEILFIKRHFNPEPETQGNHMCDQFFGFHARPGGGIFVIKNPFALDPTKQDIRNILDNTKVASGRLEGTSLDKTWGFLAPELSFDGKKLVFAAADTKVPRHTYTWTTENCYHLFEVDLENGMGMNLVQMTDGPWNDIDPCFLPNGRIAFMSERRGGYGRCHGRPVPSYTLHSMNYDASDITMLSPHETNEWKPSIDHNGMIIYTRWDYVDRGFNQAHHPWITTPDGRDARALHGNFSEVQHSRPQFETTLRAIPNSNKIIGIASMHHGQYFGSVIIVDPTVEDDGAMSQCRRVTPEQLFPEVENAAHRDPANYGQPFPLDEDFHLVVYDAFSGQGAGPANNYGLYLLDSFGNKVLIYRDPEISIQCPIPLRARTKPPVVPHQTLVAVPLAEGEKFAGIDKDSLPKTAAVGVTNCYETQYPLPEGTIIKQLRIVQLLPKTNPYAHNPAIGYGDQKGARAILGTVPVEEDGSAFFNLPVDIPVYFQAIDQDGHAVQWMRSATYAKPGETLMCTGCHENRHQSALNPPTFPKAMRRGPSEIKPEIEGTKPFSYPLLVQPVWDKNCVDCHEKEAAAGKTFKLSKGSLDQHFYESYNNLRPHVFYYNSADWTTAQTIPGRFGAKASKLWKVLEDGHYDVELSEEERHRILLWLDNNADFYGVYEHESLPKQRRGEDVKPGLE